MSHSRCLAADVRAHDFTLDDILWSIGTLFSLAPQPSLPLVAEVEACGARPVWVFKERTAYSIISRVLFGPWLWESDWGLAEFIV